MKHPLYRRPAVVFAFLAAVSLLFWWRPLANTFALALVNDAYTHILLILPLSAALSYMHWKYDWKYDWKYLDSKHPDSPALQTYSHRNQGLSAALLILALLLGCYAGWGMRAATDDVRLSVSMFSLVIWWLAAVLLSFGKKIFQSFLLPLCFLFLMVPIPMFVLNWVVEFLQQQSALAARIMFRAVGVPVTQDGIMLYVAGLNVEVARECSSIRSSLMLVVTTIVLAHLFLRSRWRKILLVALTIPLSVAKNGLRIFTIVELGTRVDPGFLTGKLHHNGGIIFFGVAVIAAVLVLWILRRTESRTSLTQPSPVPE